MEKEIWVKGQVPDKLYGTIKILLTHGPKGFGMQISRSVGDVPLTVNFGKKYFQTNNVFVYELLPERAKEMLKRRRK